jgi:uncharacterized membrane protein affecting hemolysin expression
MNHSFHSADRATHRRVIGLACVTTLLVCLFGISFFAKSQQHATSASALKAGMPVTTSDGGYAIIR